MKEVDYTKALTREDKMRIYFVKRKGKIDTFIIQYLGLYNGKWRSILRVDTCHGYPHIHTYHLQKNESVFILGHDKSENNELFTAFSEYITTNFQKIKANFVFSK